MDEFSGRVAVVTGAASGIGRSLARRFAAEGMRVVLSDANAAGLAEAVDEIAATGADATGVVADVGERDDIMRLRDETYARYGTAHVVCNNAGVGARSRLVDADFAVDDWRRVVDIDFYGIVYGVEAFLPRLLEQNEGHVVNTASRQGLVGSGGGGAYCAAKAAAVALSETLHGELSGLATEVGVSVLCPGGVRTGMLRPPSELPDTVPPELRSLMAERYAEGVEPDDVAALVVRAIRARRLYVLTHAETLDWMTERQGRIAEDVAALGALH